jgi:integrase
VKIYKNEDGKWCFDVTCNGRRVRQIVGLSRPETEQAMLNKLTDLKRDKFGIEKPRGNVFFEEFADEFLEVYSKQNKRSWVRDRSAIKHFNEFFKGKVLSAISPELIERYKAARKDEGANPATINRELACLKTIFNIAILWGKTDFSPAKQIKRIPVNNIREKFLSDEEMRRLVGAADPEIKPVLIIALSTGMRRNEILDLKWQNVHFEGKYIFIEYSKSGKTRRVPMNDLIIEALKNVPKVSEFVFYSPKIRAKISISTVRTAFLKACEKAKIKDLRFHDLRHCAASAMVRRGIDLVTVSKILGHSSIIMTMRYAHSTPENMRLAIDSLGEILEGSQAMQKNQEKSGKIPVIYGIESAASLSNLTN